MILRSVIHKWTPSVKRARSGRWMVGGFQRRVVDEHSPPARSRKLQRMTAVARIALDPHLSSSGLDLYRLADALAGMREDVVFSHRSAAHLWGLWIPRFGGIEVTSPACERASAYTTGVQRSAVVAHRRILPPEDVVLRHGLPVTTRERTWVDLAAILGIHDLVAAGDSALRAGASGDLIAAQVAALRRIRGAVLARRAVPLLNKRSASRPESRIRTAILLAGLPAPRVNQAVFDEHGQWLAEPDMHYEQARLALEYNGSDHANEGRMRKDSSRLLDLQRAGWEVRTYTAPHAYRRLDEVVHDVDMLLRRRAPELLTARFRR